MKLLKLDDNLFCALLLQKKIKQIDTNAEVAISMVTQAITTRAAVEKGKVPGRSKRTMDTFHPLMAPSLVGCLSKGLNTPLPTVG